MIDTKELGRFQTLSTTTSPVWHTSRGSESSASTDRVAPPLAEDERTDIRVALKARYLERAMFRATAVLLDDTMWFADIASIPDVWGNGDTQEASIEKLESVLSEWLDWKLEDHDDDIPVIDGIDLTALS